MAVLSPTSCRAPLSLHLRNRGRLIRSLIHSLKHSNTLTTFSKLRSECWSSFAACSLCNIVHIFNQLNADILFVIFFQVAQTSFFVLVSFSLLTCIVDQFLTWNETWSLIFFSSKLMCSIYHIQHNRVDLNQSIKLDSYQIGCWPLIVRLVDSRSHFILMHVITWESSSLFHFFDLSFHTVCPDWNSLNFVILFQNNLVCLFFLVFQLSLSFKIFIFIYYKWIHHRIQSSTIGNFAFTCQLHHFCLSSFMPFFVQTFADFFLFSLIISRTIRPFILFCVKFACCPFSKMCLLLYLSLLIGTILV